MMGDGTWSHGVWHHPKLSGVSTGAGTLLETLLNWDVDYDYLARSILEAIEENIEKHRDAIDENWGGDVDAVRAEVVDQTLKYMKAKGTRVGHWEADALSRCYRQMYDEPLPSASS